MKVFWSWQSDTPGKTGRHFVRAALEAAVAALKEEADIEEPTQRELRDGLHIDSDRQGVPGSPDLAATILDKIVNSDVFIADVTPVSTIAEAAAGRQKRPEKRNMNPNVAIELGYAMRALSDEKILMVLNEWYGGREFLPFDLSHKAGPITFSLPPEPTRETIAGVKALLVGQFVTALRPYLLAAPVAAERPLFVEAPSTLSRAVYFQAKEDLATFGEPGHGDRDVYRFPNGRGFYLRMHPKFALPRRLSPADMNEHARQQRLPLMWFQRGMCLSSRNRYGAIVIERRGSAEGEIDAATQIFPNGELWGINRRLITVQESDKLLGMKSIENVFTYTLFCYSSFIRDELKASLPYVVEFGAVGVYGYRIVTDPGGYNRHGPIYQDDFSFHREIEILSDDSLNQLLSELFDNFFELSGDHRPEQ